MAVLLLIAHAPLATALEAVAQHVYPDCAVRLRALDVAPGETPETIEARARAVLDELGSGETLIMTDVFGATPGNVAQKLADGVKVKVLTGVSVPMLWRALCYSSESVDALAARALAGAVQGTMQVASARPQFQAQPLVSTEDDQVHAAHQQ
jgi:PTS system mannose-specific IIA component